MCVYSMVADNWSQRRRDFYEPIISPDSFKIIPASDAATKADLEELRQELRTELKELKKLLKAAAEYDAATGQPDCEQEEKIALIRKMAELTGVDMEDCLPKKPDPAPACEQPSTRLAKRIEDALGLTPASTTISVGGTTVTTHGEPANSSNVSWVTNNNPFSGNQISHDT